MKPRLDALMAGLGRLGGFLRRASGDDAYERFVAHRRAVHSDEPLPSRREFWRGEVERKWQRVTRCC